MFTQSMYFRVSVIQNEVKDLANVSCEVPARDPSRSFRMTKLYFVSKTMDFSLLVVYFTSTLTVVPSLIWRILRPFCMVVMRMPLTL